MESVMEFYKWCADNSGELAAFVLGLLGVAEIVVRLTPTKTDDGVVERIGGYIHKVLDFFKLPNKKKEEPKVEEKK